MTLGEEFVNIKCDPKEEFATLSTSCPFLLSSLGAPDHPGHFLTTRDTFRRGRKKETSVDMIEKTRNFVSYVRHNLIGDKSPQISSSLRKRSCTSLAFLRNHAAKPQTNG